MRSVPFKETMTTFIVVAVVVLLIGTLVFPSLTVLADDDDEEVGVPQWNEGDRWRYRDEIPMPEMGPLETVIEREVTNDHVQVNAHGEGGERESYDTYEVRETHNPEDDEKWEADFYYWKDNLAQIYNDPEGQVPSAYHPPIVELDFPLYVGKEWDGEARYFENPGDPDEGEHPEADREYAFWGRVENKTTIEIGIGEFETYMVNLTVIAYDPDTEDAQLHRYETYYSPEVKNRVYTDIFETRALPEDQTGPGDIEYDEAPIGNETLLEFDVEPYEPSDGREESLLGVGIVLLIIGVGSASFYIYKKVKSSM